MSYNNYKTLLLVSTPPPFQIEVYNIISRCALMYIYMQAALREQPPVVMLVGNKTDQHSKREVTSEDGRQLALVHMHLHTK